MIRIACRQCGEAARFCVSDVPEWSLDRAQGSQDFMVDRCIDHPQIESMRPTWGSSHPGETDHDPSPGQENAIRALEDRPEI